MKFLYKVPGYSLLLFGAVLLGIARSSGDMSRYVAAEIFPSDQRGRVIGIIVFAATIGAVGGPLLVVFTTGPARSIGLPEFAGPWIATSIALLFAALVTWLHHCLTEIRLRLQWLLRLLQTLWLASLLWTLLSLPVFRDTIAAQEPSRH